MNKRDVELSLQRIDENLRIGSWSLTPEGELIYCRISFPLKNNKVLIEKLIDAGWELDGRHKVCSESHRGAYARNQYSGYEMYQSMRLDIRGN